MVSRCKYQSSSEIGAYARITNSYALLPIGQSDNQFISHFENAFNQMGNNKFPIINSNIAGTSIVGRLTVGNKYGLILPITATSNEIDAIRNSLPDEVELAQVDEKFSALGNVISCNDKIALVHPELDPETIELIQDVLRVEVLPSLIGGEALVGSYSVFTNRGGIVNPNCTVEQIQELNDQLGLKLEPATVNRGSNLVSSGICANDNVLLCGWDTSALEIANLTRIFKIDDSQGRQKGGLDIDEELMDLII